MTYRLDDWTCSVCGTVREDMTEKGGPREIVIPCLTCQAETPHSRKLSAPAPYLGERVRNTCSPRIKGGTYDTEGFQQGPAIPDLPGAEEHDRRVARALAALPADATRQDRKATVREVSKGGPDIGDYKAHLAKPDNKAILAKRAQIAASNAEKKKRAPLLDSGQTTVRQTPVPGDAKELHR